MACNQFFTVPIYWHVCSINEIPTTDCNKGLTLSASTNTNSPKWYGIILFGFLQVNVQNKQEIITSCFDRKYFNPKNVEIRMYMACFYSLHSCSLLTWQTDLSVECWTLTHPTGTSWNAGWISLYLQSVGSSKQHQQIEIFLSYYYLSVFCFTVSVTAAI